MALIGSLVKSGVLGATSQLLSRFVPQGTGYNISRAIANVGQALHIPEVHASEAFGGYQPSSPQVLGITSSNNTGLNYSPYNPTQQSPYNPSPTRRTSGGGGQVLGAGTAGAEGLINANAGDLQGQADYEFGLAMDEAARAEGLVRSQAGIEETRQTQTGQQAETRAGEAKQAQLTGLGQELQTGEKTASGGLRDVRDLFRQLQQENTAKLSGLGISSSSVTEALAERLGVETARRIAGITGNLDEIRTNIAKEKTRLESVFQSKITEIQQNTKLAVDEVRSGLMQALGQIGQARTQAAGAKAQARTQAVIDARNQILQIKLADQQRQQTITDAASRRQQALADAEATMFKPTDFTGIQNYLAGNQAAIKGTGLQGQYGFEPTQVQGQTFLRPSASFSPKKEQEANEGDISPDGTQIYLGGQWQSLQ